MNRSTLVILAAVLLAIGGLACATTGGAGGSSVSMSSMRYSGDDLAETQHQNLYDFLQDHNQVRVGRIGGGSRLGVRHRGQYVEARLYVDDSDVADPISRLRQIGPGEVESLRILTPDEASSRYGGRGTMAVISVTLE